MMSPLLDHSSYASPHIKASLGPIPKPTLEAILGEGKGKSDMEKRCSLALF
jgi:hypothetical protein